MSAIPHYPRRHSISAEEYLRMTAAGVFQSDSRLELMDGEIIDMAPIGSRHASVVNSLASMFVRTVGDGAIVSVQNPVIVSSLSVPQPDLLVLKHRADRYFGAHPRTDDVLLVVEVADTSLRFDLEQKIPMYGRAGIVEAWLIDIDRREIHICGSPDSVLGYRTKSIASIAEKVSAAALPDAVIDIAGLFPG